MRFNTLAKDFKESSFLSCEKDCETILRKLFIENQPYSNKLKRLLIINAKDCLDNEKSEVYKKAIDLSINEMIEQKYINLVPRIARTTHEEIKSQIIISFDTFAPTSNDEFRDCLIQIDILCHPEYWDLGGFRLRPLKIAGYIDGILNKARLSGIGQLNFYSCNELVLDETFCGYTLKYIAVHGSDDLLEE